MTIEDLKLQRDSYAQNLALLSQKMLDKRNFVSPAQMSVWRKQKFALKKKLDRTKQKIKLYEKVVSKIFA